VKEQATYLAYAGGWRAVRLMPERLAYAMFDRIADQQWRTHGPSVRRLEANLGRVVGPVAPDELRELSREGMRSYMRYWCDAFRLPGWDGARIDTFEMRHPERLSDPVESGRGVVAALPHMGNWDHAGAWCSQHISAVNTVAEKLEPEQLYTAFVDFRTSLGMHIHGLGDPGVYQQLRGTLESGGLVALLADRDLSAKGVDVQFFGETARFPAGPAALAVDTGASLVPVKLFWAGHNVAEILPEIEAPSAGDRDARIRMMTQAVADALAAGIAEHPTDWHMLQRLWLSDLDQARLAAQGASEREA
jgi:phosphatidylinositol dimannoside acyltransferase